MDIRSSRLDVVCPREPCGSSESVPGPSVCAGGLWGVLSFGDMSANHANRLQWCVPSDVWCVPAGVVRPSSRGVSLRWGPSGDTPRFSSGGTQHVATLWLCLGDSQPQRLRKSESGRWPWCVPAVCGVSPRPWGEMRWPGMGGRDDCCNHCNRWHRFVRKNRHSPPDSPNFVTT